MVSVYFDASVLVALFIASDPFHRSAPRAYLAAQPRQLIVSDFAAAEFASAVSRRVRSKDLTADDATAIFTSISMPGKHAQRQQVDTTTPDIAVAASVLRRLDLNLRTPDAINIAVADRLGADARNLRREDGDRRARTWRAGGAGLT